MNKLSNVMWLHPNQSEIRRFSFISNLCRSMVQKDETSKFFCLDCSREIFPVSVSLNCRMGMSSPRAGRRRRNFQECPIESSSFCTARWTCGSAPDERSLKLRSSSNLLMMLSPSAFFAQIRGIRLDTVSSKIGMNLSQTNP